MLVVFCDGGYRGGEVSLIPAPFLHLEQLTRHAVCVGATGSGKTGLCVGLLEDLALAGVPVLAIDPKGDLANLALVLDPKDPAAFAPWVADGSPAEAAAAWQRGWEAAGIGEAALAAWRRGVEVRVLTPGSESGTPVDVLSAITRAPAALVDDPEGLREYVTGAVSALLGLIGREADPLTDPAAVLLARLLGEAFAAGRPMPIEALIPAVVDPPFSNVGFFGTDTFLTREDRLELAKALNVVVESPAFAAWRVGVPLDVGAWLTPTPQPDGRTRTPLYVLYLAHLGDAQRMFFVTLLLHAVVGWTRRLAGSARLRALMYFDEVMGYLPPHPKDPPSKAPVLTLMKQARGVGVGVVLATQNPVDVDYKAMSNAGTWLVGRLRTRQDRQRVLDGLSSVGVDPDTIGDDLAELPGRAFLVLDGQVRRVSSRHTMSFLRGPLTRAEVARLPTSWRASRTAEDGLLSAPPPPPTGLAARWLTGEGADGVITQILGHAADGARAGLPVGEGVVWRAIVYGRLRIRFASAVAVEERLVHRLVVDAGPVDSLAGLPEAYTVEIPDPALARRCPAGGRYLPPPAWLGGPRSVDRLLRAWIDRAAVDEVGPDDAPFADRDDIRMDGVALVWVPTRPAPGGAANPIPAPAG